MATAPTPPTGGDKAPKPTSIAWDRLKTRANTIGSIAALFLFLLFAGGLVGFFVSQTRKAADPAKPPTVQTLSPEDLQKLTEIGANLGTSGQVLNIGANALFRGKIDVGGDLSIGGRLNANGPVTLSQLNITGSTAATGLNVGSNLIVGGTTSVRNLTVQGLATVNGGLNVSGSASINAINANSIAVRNISISGPLTIGHLSTQGPTPAASAGAVGGGGTISISGNDTAGTVNINTGSGPGANVTLITVAFRAGYTTTPHVLLTPRTAAAASALAYVVPSGTNFRILAVNPPAGSTLTYDYLVTQ